MCLILAQLLVTFGVYSYVHEYTNSHVSDNAYFNN